MQAVETVPRRLVSGEPERDELHSLIDTLPIEQVRATLQFVKSASGKNFS